jgi:hypothetical protein
LAGWTLGYCSPGPLRFCALYRDGRVAPVPDEVPVSGHQKTGSPQVTRCCIWCAVIRNALRHRCLARRPCFTRVCRPNRGVRIAVARTAATWTLHSGRGRAFPPPQCLDARRRRGRRHPFRLSSGRKPAKRYRVVPRETSCDGRPSEPITSEISP